MYKRYTTRQTWMNIWNMSKQKIDNFHLGQPLNSLVPDNLLKTVLPSEIIWSLFKMHPTILSFTEESPGTKCSSDHIWHLFKMHLTILTFANEWPGTDWSSDYISDTCLKCCWQHWALLMSHQPLTGQVIILDTCSECSWKYCHLPASAAVLTGLSSSAHERWAPLARTAPGHPPPRDHVTAVWSLAFGHPVPVPADHFLFHIKQQAVAKVQTLTFIFVCTVSGFNPLKTLTLFSASWIILMFP